MKFAPTAALPIVAINLTHGTGSETNRFAVVTIPEKHYKPAIAYDCIYPTWAIDDPVHWEEKLNQIVGVVTVGLFAKRGADVLLLGTKDGVKTLTP